MASKKKTSAESDENTPTAQDVIDKHAFASSLYAKANKASNEVLKLITTGIEIPTDVGSQITNADARVTKPVLPFAIINRISQMLQIESAEWQVMPTKTGNEEQAACTKLERYSDGVCRRMAYETKRNWKRDGRFWFLARGVARYEVDLDTKAVGKNTYPVKIYTDDPATIYPVHGRDEILYYTKEYIVYGQELKRSLQRLGVAVPPGVSGTEPCTVIEYKDDTYKAAVLRVGAGGGDDQTPENKKGKSANDTLLYAKPHKFGFVPLAEARCLDTPMEQAEWSYQSVIGPVVDHIKQTYLLASKMATGVNLFYYPMMFYTSASGIPVVFDPSNPGELAPKAPDSKIEVLNITVNTAALQMLMAFFKNDISLATLPETSFGQEPASLTSGFAISQVLSQVRGAIDDKLPELERAMGDTMGNVLRLAYQFLPADDLDWGVPVTVEE